MANVTNGTAYFRFGNPNVSCTGKGVCKMVGLTTNPSSTILKTCVMANLRSTNDNVIGHGKFIESMDIVFNSDILADLLRIDQASYSYVADPTTKFYIPDLASLSSDFKIDPNIVHMLWSTAPFATAFIPAVPSTGSSPLWNLTQTLDANGNLVQVRITIDNIHLTV
jgi:hypothetical protein